MWRRWGEGAPSRRVLQVQVRFCLQTLPIFSRESVMFSFSFMLLPASIWIQFNQLLFCVLFSRSRKAWQPQSKKCLVEMGCFGYLYERGSCKIEIKEFGGFGLLKQKENKGECEVTGNQFSLSSWFLRSCLILPKMSILSGIPAYC